MGNDKDQSAELQQLRRQLADLHDEVARNEGILRKSQDRELALLQAGDLRALFRTMVIGLADSCGLAQVTIVVCDPDHDIRHLLVAGGKCRGLGSLDALCESTNKIRQLVADGDEAGFAELMNKGREYLAKRR